MKTFPLETPAFRAVQVIPVNQAGQQLLVFQDPMGLIDEPVVMAPDAILITLLQTADGETHVSEIARIIREETDAIVTADKVLHFVQFLDKAGLMMSENYLKLIEEREEDWRSVEKRHQLLFNSDDRLAVIKALGDEFRRHLAMPQSPPSKIDLPGKLRAILCPHIDYMRGGPAYGWAYQALKQNTEARRFVILGTVHMPVFEPFIMTDKPFETVLGTTKTDRDLISRIDSKYEGNLHRQEYMHQAETTIELQVLYLQHLFGPENFTFVPILVGSFDQYFLNPKTPLPEQVPEIKSMISVLSEIIQNDPGVVVIGGVDFSHCGQEFGDEELVTEDIEDSIEHQDAKMMEKIHSIDYNGFFEHFRPDENERKVCSIAPIYTLLASLGNNAKATKLTYQQANSDDRTCMVSFGSFAFTEGSKIILET